jgi:hypothetical protein
MYTLGVYIGTPITALVLTGLAMLWRATGRWRPDDCFDAGSRTIALWVLPLCMVVTAGIWLGAMWPLVPSYHRWHEKTGTVEYQESRLLGHSDSGMSEVFLIKFEGNTVLYRCDDTRCALAEKGKHIRLLCKPQFEYAGTDGWVCRYGQTN